MTGFKITSHKGFHITSPNGVTLSTQFGGGNYCINYDIVEIGSEKETRDLSSPNAEIAIWDKNGKWLTAQMEKELFKIRDGYDVRGHVDIDEWLKILDWCKNYEVEND